MSVWGPSLVIGKAKPDYSDIYIEQGSISSSNGENTQDTSTNRIRTHGYIPISDSYTYQINCNIARVYVYYYDASKTMIGNSGGWLTPLPTTVTPTTNSKYMRMVISKSSGTVSPSNVTYFTVDQIERIIDL